MHVDPSAYPALTWRDPATASAIELFVDQMEQYEVMVAAGKLRLGACTPPKVWCFIDTWDPPITATISTRPYYPGRDAANAIADLGLVPAAIMPTRLMLMWDEYDLRTSLYGEGEHAHGLVVLHATPGAHLLHWYPYSLHIANPARPFHSMTIAWSQPTAHADATLPNPITQILNRWWQPSPPDASVLSSLQAAGYNLTYFEHD